ncbi:MAG TPA: biopolymer transporter ExbD [Sulfuricaulis sp.]
MKMSRRAKRMDRHHARSRLLTGLNMVSLMDIFTILVFFLLVNSSDIEILPSVKSVKLPESVAEKVPKQTVVIVVNDQDVLVQGRKVASVADIFKTDGELIEPLKTELDYQASRDALVSKGGGTGRAITIMGDKEIPYRLLKKIMVTCVRAKYDNISLAVVKKIQAKG